LRQFQQRFAVEAAGFLGPPCGCLEGAGQPTFGPFRDEFIKHDLPVGVNVVLPELLQDIGSVDSREGLTTDWKTVSIVMTRIPSTSRV